MHHILKTVTQKMQAAAPLFSAIASGKRENVTRLLAVNSLFREDKIVTNFSNMGAAFHSIDMPLSGADPSPLATGPVMAMPKGYAPWCTARTVTSALVMQDGTIRHEAYYHGTTATDRRISWSVAKSYLSALFGILVAEGAIESLDDPVRKYAPQLSGGAYARARIIDVLQMSSGIAFNEDYLDYDSDINRMGRVLALGRKMDDFAAALTATDAAPGQYWDYTSIDTHVIGMVARGATGRDIPSLLNEKILSKLGLEHVPFYLTDGVGEAFVLGGLNFTTRDYARFGQMILQNGLWEGTRIVPADWIATSTLPSANTEIGEFGYGYQWWIPSDARPGEEFLARGIYGQYIYFHRAFDVVIVSTGADRLFREEGVAEENVAMFRQIAAATQG